MKTMDEQIEALAPTPTPLDDAWSQTTVAGILSASTPNRGPWWRRTRRRAAVLVAAGIVTATAGTAVAVGGPAEVVKDAILDFSQQPNTTGNGLGRLHDPQLVAKFRMPTGLFAIWLATSSSGKVCYASSDAAWNGKGNPTRRELEYGCGGEIVTNSGGLEELTRPDQLGGFFKDFDGPIVYGVSPYAAARTVRVQGIGVDRTLPVRADSHGYGLALPEASNAPEVTLTFVDAAGTTLGSKLLVAPVG